jgi:hypothetical protein
VTERFDALGLARTPGYSPAAAAASTLLGVSLLGYEGQLVEIEAVAVAGSPDVTVG